MSQTPTTGYTSRSADPSKALDYALVIAGWPTVYTVASAAYTIPTSGADICTDSGFTALRAWASCPDGSNAKVKGRPEEGSMTVGSMQVTVQDRIEGGVRAMSDLISRPAYVLGSSTGYSTTLNGTITRTGTTVILTDATNFAAASVIHIGQECILLGTKVGSTFSNCTRGYRLTNKVAHATLVKVYSFLPAVYRQKAFIYKGYQQQPFSDWLRAYAGVITGDEKVTGAVDFTISSAASEFIGGNVSIINGDVVNGATPTVDGGTLVDTTLFGDFDGVVIDVRSITAGTLNNGHYVVRIGNTLAGIRSAV